MTIRNRKVYCDAIRILAVICVIFHHTNARGYIYFTTVTTGSPIYWSSMTCGVLSGISVPLFFMVSGVTLLGKEESIANVWKKRISRFFIVLILFSLLQYLIKLNFNWSQVNGIEFLKSIYSSSIIVPYWYLYGYLGFLVVLPFLRKLAKNMTEKECYYMIALSVVFQGVIPCIQYRLSAGTITLNSSFDIGLAVNAIVLYPLIGFFADKKMISKKMIMKLWGGPVYL